MVLTWPVRIGDESSGRARNGRARREILRWAALTALSTSAVSITACNPFNRRTEPAPPDPLAPLLTGALELAAAYEATIAAHPDLADRLSQIASAHRAHVAELTRMTGTTAATPSPGAGAVAPTPMDRDGALTALRERERRGQDTAVEACLNAPADRVALIGSIAAARASHLEILR